MSCSNLQFSNCSYNSKVEENPEFNSRHWILNVYRKDRQLFTKVWYNPMEQRLIKLIVIV